MHFTALLNSTKELDVEVLTEYYVWNTFSLVGNVGGQMGLFISFHLLVVLDGSWTSLKSYLTPQLISVFNAYNN